MANKERVLLSETTIGAGGVTTNSNTFINAVDVGGKFVLNITALSGVGATITFNVQGKDAASGDWYTTATDSETATGQSIIDLYPGVSGDPGNIDVSAQTILPRVYRVQVVSDANTDSATFSASAVLLD